MSTENNRQPRILLDRYQAAAHLGVTPRWITRAVAQKRIPFVKLGAMVRFEPAALDEFLAAARVEPLR